LNCTEQSTQKGMELAVDLGSTRGGCWPRDPSL